MEREIMKEVSHQVLRSGWESCDDSWSCVISALGPEYNFRQWDWWSVTDDWTCHKDSGLVTWNSQGQIGSFRILWFIHCGGGETGEDVWPALALSGNRFYALESVSSSFFSRAISSTGLFILLVCIRKTHSGSKCIRIQWLV